MKTKGRVLCALAALALVAMSAGSASAAEAVVCANEEARVEQRATYLPDCRAYEKVSPADKEGYGVFNELSQAAVAGGGIGYSSFGAFSGAEGAGAVNTYVARRGETAWQTKNVSPRMNPFFSLNIPFYGGFNADLSKLALTTRTPPQQPGAPSPSETFNLFIRDTGSDQFRLISTEPPPFDPFGFGGRPDFVDASADFEDVLFETLAGYLPGTGGNNNLFVKSGDAPLRLVAGNADPGAGPALDAQNTISDDGSRIFFTSPSTNQNKPFGQLYLEDDGAKVHVSAPQRPNLGPDPAGTKAAFYRGASADGSVAFFSSEEKLTEDATAAEGAPDLYRYDVESGVLTDLTVTAGGAGILGVARTSEDGHRVYFAAKSVLAPGATAGEPNFYLWDDSGGTPATTFIATLLPGETAVWDPPGVRRSAARVTPDGSHIAFQSAAPIAGFPSAGHEAVYVFSAASGELQCASCRPDGGASTADSDLQEQRTNFGIPTPFVSRNLSDDGRVLFFESAEPLVARDSNGRLDVYAFATDSGEVSLLSSGTSEFDSYFANSDPSGTEAFFTTQQQLSPWDQDQLVDLYTARVDGGLPGPPVGPAPCSGEGCRAPVTTPPPVEPSSSRLVGPPNAAANRCGALAKRAGKARSRARGLQRRASSARGRRATTLRKKAKRARGEAQRLAKQNRACKAAQRSAR